MDKWFINETQSGMSTEEIYYSFNLIVDSNVTHKEIPLHDDPLTILNKSHE